MGQSEQTYGAGRTASSYGRDQYQGGGYSAPQGTYEDGGFDDSQQSYSDML